MSSVPTIDKLRAFLHKQIAECRQYRPEDVDDLLEKLRNIEKHTPSLSKRLVTELLQPGCQQRLTA